MLISRRFSVAAVISFCFFLAACGGGGGGKQSQPAITMSVSPASISVSASGTAFEPVTAKVKGEVSSLPKKGLYIGYATNNTSIQSLDFSQTSKLEFEVGIQFDSPTKLNPGTYPGIREIAVCLDSSCKKQISNSPQDVNVTYTVQSNPDPVLTSISPNFAQPGSGAFTITAQGSKFMQDATIDWNGGPLTTRHVSSSRLTATVPAADIGTAGTAEVTVMNPRPNNGPSNALAFPIRYGRPSIDSLFPNAAVKGGPDFTLTVAGSGFGSGSQVQWNGVPRTTQFVSGAELTARIAAADISTAGSAAVAVYDPVPGTRSAPVTFAINPATRSAVSYQINTSHSGDMNFDPVNFPTQSAWKADFNGQPFYILIADDKVFVIAHNPNGGFQLSALDQKTGAAAWGPIAVAGDGAYDEGSVYAVVGNALRAYNASTGSVEWNTQLTGEEYIFDAPVARNGFVYIIGDDFGGTLYALDESDGSLVWTKPVQGESTPAVTADGIYVADLCSDFDFRPGTGEDIWRYDLYPSGCSGGGSGTPVVSGGTLYAPDGSGDGYSGNEFDAESGELIGPYASDNSPAIASGDGYFLRSGTLYGIDLANNDVLWSFAGDGSLVMSPIVVNQYVIISSSSGNLYALDRMTGQEVWQVNVGAAIPAGYAPGLSAGHGLLIVPTNDSVVAYRLAND